MRRWGIIVILGLILALLLSAYALRPIEVEPRDFASVRASSERGEYLIRLGGCVACHTDSANGGAYLAGGAGLKTPFGEFVPPNITSHAEAGIGGWSLEEFARALGAGEGPGSLGHYYPAFPYDNYTLMSDQDVADLFAALKEVTPVAQPSLPHRIGFPFNIRLSMLAWKNLFFTPARFEPVVGRSPRWNRGNYLANGPAHCTACHTPRNLFGARDDARAFAGGSGTPGGNVPNITAARLQAEGYDIAGLVDTLKTGFTPGFNVLGEAMGEVIEQSTSHWTDADLTAISAYLLNEN